VVRESDPFSRFNDEISRAQQSDADLGELSGRRVNLNRPAMLLDDNVVADREAKTGALSGRLCGEETTGRGSAFGCKPTPSIKLATNTEMYRRMTDDMDINCGDVLDGISIEAKGQEIFDKMLEVASGRHTKSEDLGYGELEFVPWQIGAVM
jgi:altronate dehydratase